MTEQFHFFWRGPLSQWKICSFIVDGIEYNCGEQYMMAKKALMFYDIECYKKIMNTPSPNDQKAYGRQVSPFSESYWNKYCRQIVYDGNYAKFSQNEDLLKELLSTRGKTIVEASPMDRIWGIGLAASDPRALDKATWLGHNWLGQALTKVRDQFHGNASGETNNLHDVS